MDHGPQTSYAEMRQIGHCRPTPNCWNLCMVLLKYDWSRSLFGYCSHINRKIVIVFESFISTVQMVHERGDHITQNLHELILGLDKTKIALDNASNQLMALQHKQYVENRVYDDDEMLANIENVVIQNPSDVPVCLSSLILCFQAIVCNLNWNNYCEYSWIDYISRKQCLAKCLSQRNKNGGQILW